MNSTGESNAASKQSFTAAEVQGWISEWKHRSDGSVGLEEFMDFKIAGIRDSSSVKEEHVKSANNSSFNTGLRKTSSSFFRPWEDNQFDFSTDKIEEHDDLFEKLTGVSFANEKIDKEEDTDDMKDKAQQSSLTNEMLSELLTVGLQDLPQLFKLCEASGIDKAFLSYQRPKSLRLECPWERFAEAYDTETGRLNNNFYHLVDELAGETDFPCAVNGKNKRRLSEKNFKHSFSFDAKCGGECQTKIKGKVSKFREGSVVVITLKMEGDFRLIQPKATGRWVNGSRRAEMKKSLESRKAYDVFLDREKNVLSLRFLHNNHPQRSRSVLDMARSEHNRRHRISCCVTEDLKRMEEEFKENPDFSSSRPDVLDHGLIRECCSDPFRVQYHSPQQVQLGSLMAVWIIDSTGSITGNVAGRQTLKHAIVGKSIRNYKIPGALLSQFHLSCNDTFNVSVCLKKYLQDVRKIDAVFKPDAIVSDMAFPYLHAASEGLNGEKLLDGINRLWSHLQLGTTPGTEYTDIYLCRLHVINAFSKNLAKKNVPKEIRKLALYGLAKLQESESIEAMKENLTKFITVFGTKWVPTQVLQEFIHDLEHSSITNPSTEEVTNFFLTVKTEEGLNEMFVDKQTGPVLHNNKFYQYFVLREQTIQTEASGESNDFFNVHVMDAMRSTYFPFVSFWSSCSPRGHQINKAGNKNLSTGPVENYFQKVKNILHVQRRMDPVNYIAEHAPKLVGMTKVAMDNLLKDIVTKDKPKVAKKTNLIQSEVHQDEQSCPFDEDCEEDEIIKLESEVFSQKTLPDAQFHVPLRANQKIKIPVKILVDELEKKKALGLENSQAEFLEIDACIIEGITHKNSPTVPEECGQDSAQHSKVTWKKQSNTYKSKYQNIQKRHSLKAEQRSTEAFDISQNYQRKLAKLRGAQKRRKTMAAQKLSTGKLVRRPRKGTKTKQKSKNKREKIKVPTHSADDEMLEVNLSDSDSDAEVFEGGNRDTETKVDPEEVILSDSENDVTQIEDHFQVKPFQILNVFKVDDWIGNEWELASLYLNSFLWDGVVQGYSQFLINNYGRPVQANRKKDVLVPIYFLRALRSATFVYQEGKPKRREYIYRPNIVHLPNESGFDSSDGKLYVCVQGRDHFKLEVADFSKMTITCYDSLSNSLNSVFSSNEKRSQQEAILQGIQAKYGIHTHSWTRLEGSAVQQQNGYDCGIFTTENLRCELMGIPVTSVNPKAGSELRDSIAATLLLTAENGLALLQNFGGNLHQVRPILFALNRRTRFRSRLAVLNSRKKGIELMEETGDNKNLVSVYQSQAKQISEDLKCEESPCTLRATDVPYKVSVTVKKETVTI